MNRNLEPKHGSAQESKPEQWRRFSDHVPLVVEVEL
jgi:endonuclease/exonuclease/phosphatase family metal-dependent hydrolase